MTNFRKRKVKEIRSLLKSFRMPRDVAEKHVLDVAQTLWYRFDTPTSLGLYLCVKYGDIRSVLTHEIDPSSYTSAEAFYLDYQAVSFLKKCPLSVVTQSERELSAQKKFLETEEQCRRTNSRFRDRYASGITTPDVEAVLFRTQQKIASWIGEGPNPHDWLSRCRFGPGADNLAKGSRVGSYHKLEALSSTEDFADGALAMALDHPVWGRHLAGVEPYDEDDKDSTISLVLAPGNRVVFVPKTALVDRPIAIEPRMNVFAQLGLGSILRDMLKTRAHLDLDKQDPNQDLAFEASQFGHLATIDLSSASDTVSRELVRDLLPAKWYLSLDWCRCKRGTLKDGSVIRYEKFSSMGNGFTFELETLIFLALSSACCDHLGLVNHYTRAFGDDIICPVEAVALLEEVLTYCGFSVNRKKSFSSGVFRESCGADFFDGTNVRPHFLREVPTNAKSLFNLANGINRASCRLGRGWFRDRRFRPALLRTVRRIPEPLRAIHTQPVVRSRLWGPELEAGDGGLVLDQDEFLSSILTRYCREYQAGYHFGTVVSRPWVERGQTTPSLVYLYALYRCKDGLDDEVAPGLITGRGSIGDRLYLGAYAPRLENLGPFL
jgi:hypothetical protein